MKEGQSKKVIIINDIKSETVEQAILILKKSGKNEASVKNSSLVQEAQNIIGAYVRAAERSEFDCGRIKGRARIAPVVGCILALLTLLVAFIPVISRFF